MRKSRLALLALVLVAGTLMFPTSAFAAGGEEAGICAKELVEKLDAGEITEKEAQKKSLECFSSPSPVFPAIAEILWGSVAFAIVAGGLMKFGFPAVKKGMTARENRIREDLASAESAKQEANLKAQEYDAKLADARSEATRIVDEAKSQAGDVKADLVAKAETDAQSIRDKANADAASIKSRALSDIQEQVAGLSIDLAEIVVKKSLDKKAQMELVNSYIADLAKTSKN